MGPGGHSIRPIDETHLHQRGAGVADEGSYDKPHGYPTPKGESKEGRGPGHHTSERQDHIPAGKARFDAPLHDMSGHLGHHSAGSAHHDAFSGGGHTHHGKHGHKK